MWHHSAEDMRNLLICLLMAAVEAVVVKEGTNTHSTPTVMGGGDILQFTDTIDYSNTAPVQTAPVQTIPVMYTLQLSQPALPSSQESEKQEAGTQLIVQQAPTSLSPTEYKTFKGFSPDPGFNSLRAVPRHGYSLGISGYSPKTLSATPTTSFNPLSGQSVSYTGQIPVSSDSASHVQQYSVPSPEYVTETPTNTGKYFLSYVPSGSSNVNSGQAITAPQYSKNPIVPNLQLQYNSQFSTGASKYKLGQEFHSFPGHASQTHGYSPVQYVTSNQASQNSPLISKGSEYATPTSGQTLSHTNSVEANFIPNTNPRFSRLLHTSNLAPGQQNVRFGYSFQGHAPDINRPSALRNAEYHQNSYSTLRSAPEQINYHRTNSNHLQGNSIHPNIGAPSSSIFADSLGLGSNPKSSTQVIDQNTATGPVNFNTHTLGTTVQNSKSGLDSNRGTAVGLGTDIGTRPVVYRNDKVVEPGRGISTDTVHVTNRGLDTDKRPVTATVHNTDTKHVTSVGPNTDMKHATGTGFQKGALLGVGTGVETNTKLVPGTGHNTGTMQVTGSELDINSRKDLTGMQMTRVSASLAVSEHPVHSKTPQTQFPRVKQKIQPAQNINPTKQFAISTSNFVSGNVQTHT